MKKVVFCMIMIFYIIVLFKNEIVNNVENICNFGYGLMLNKNMYCVLGLYDLFVDLVICYIDIFWMIKVLKFFVERFIF